MVKFAGTFHASARSLSVLAALTTPIAACARSESFGAPVASACNCRSTLER